MGWLAPLGRAVRFLTLVPVPGSSDAATHDVTGALYLFPLVGLFIGALSVGSGFAAYYLFGAPVHAVAAVAATSIVTAGFHLDGLADTCDALFSWRTRERKLEIMKDSRIGAMGAVALVLVIALKITALLALGEQWWIGALLSPVFGRWAEIYGIARFPAAKNEGLASDVQTSDPSGHLPPASGLTVVAATPLLYYGEWYLLLTAFGAAFLVIHWFADAITESLGGLTGDVYGAMSEIGEVVALLAICVILE